MRSAAISESARLPYMQAVVRAMGKKLVFVLDRMGPLEVLLRAK